MSPMWPCLLSFTCLVLSGLGEDNQTEGAERCKKPSMSNLEKISPSKEYYNPSEVVTLQCEPGYYPSSDRIQCMNNGERDAWTPTAVCIERCKKPSMSNLEKISPSKEYYNPSEVVTLQCEPGYYPSSDRIQCMNNGERDAWTPTAVCIERCKKPSISNLEKISPFKEYYYLYEVVTLQCEPGYYPSSDRIQCTYNGVRDDWSPTAVCIERCKKPSISNLEKISPFKEYYYLYEVVTLQCEPGYYPSSDRIQCTYNGVRDDWSPTAVCIERCKKPSISNLEKILPSKEYYNPSEVVTLQCKPGYYPSSDRIQCMNNGERDAWTPTAVCIERCKKPSISNLEKISPSKEYYNPSEVVTLQCEPGYYPSSDRIQCMYNGERDAWSPTAVCIERCKKPSISNLEKISPSKEYYNPSEVVTLQCEPGYYPSSDRMRCMYKGERDDWTPTAVCIERCKKPSISNLEKISPSKEYYYLYEEVTLQCEPGYYPSSDRIQCTYNGVRDDWSPTAVCIERCKKPSISNLEKISPSKEYYNPSEVVTLQCEPGYYPSSDRIQCMNNGERDNWTPTAVCIERCKKPSISNLEKILPSKEYYNPSEVVRLQCEPGYYPSSDRIQCMNNGERDAWSPTAVCIEVKVTKKSVTPSSIILSIVCTPDRCGDIWTSPLYTCVLHGAFYKECKYSAGDVTFSDLDPFTQYTIPVYHTGQSWLLLQTLYITTPESAPAAPDIVRTPSMEDGTIAWTRSNAQGNITGFQMNIVAWRDYNSSFSLNITEWFPPNITQYKMNLQHGTNYTFHLRGFTSAGGGEYKSTSVETPIGDPPVPTVAIKDLTLQLQPVSDVHGPISHYEIIIFSEPRSNTSDCLGVTHTHYNSTLTPYTAALLPAHNLTEFITLGDSQHYGGFYNAPLIPNLEYMVYVRVTSKWKEAKSSCVFLDFFTAKDLLRGPVPVIAGSVAALLLLLVLLVLAGLWRTGFYRKLKKTEEIPLKSGLGKKNIPVENLLDVVKTLRYKEMFNNEEDEENADMLPAGRYLEYKELPSGLLHQCKISQFEENKIKNRYNKVVPYDDSRVMLRSSLSGSDYINASYIHGYKAQKYYIATQGPLPETVADFWSMVWQESSSVIVMLTALKEQNKVKCGLYWPEETQTYGDITVSLQRVIQTGAIITRSFSLKKVQSTVQMTVEQLHYLEWPDHGVPSKASSLVQLVEQLNKSNTPGSGPVIVHCSAGIGRTGTLIALDILLKMARDVRTVNVFSCVQRLRKSRANMVQNKKQYAFLYDILLEVLLCGMTSVPVPDIKRHLSHMTRQDPRTDMDGYDREFQALDKITELYQIYPCKEAKKPENLRKNRDSRILPDDHSRPILLSSLTRDSTPGYINAVFVNSNCLDDVMIATQLPMEETLKDFWSLVWDYKCTSVVMMHRAQDLQQIGLLRFWPHRGESNYGGFIVMATVKQSENGYRRTSLSVRRADEMLDSALDVTLWQLDSWPLDRDLPHNPSALVTLIGDVEKRQQQMADSHILVTCSDGASRCGLFCAGLILCDQIRSDGVVDVSQAVRLLRKRRCQFIPSKDQYSFCFAMVRSYLDSFETYGNFK
ncbi:tyrosine-protein phosphatase 4-like isoform X5 [Bufo gargarizans]|uniref:tyrosine-protein phosphatase 4-like isoform X5 n=1 Tax=Bufo gargarizans TaxID=30331 RepID=UPI001CF181A7|nr:tyrosine-protein phosphatase 4-like isoform X5 [Bufo gargarizans]